MGFNLRNILNIHKWKPKLYLTIDLGSQAPTWVRFLGMPMNLWNNKISRGIAYSFGSLLEIEKITQIKSHLLFTMICVSVTVNQFLPLKVNIESKLGSYIQPLYYEEKDFFCIRCKSFGHLDVTFASKQVKFRVLNRSQI